MPTQTVTKSSEMTWAKLDSERDADVRGSYEEVTTAAKRKAGAVADLQKLARAFLRWDEGTADKSVTRELKNFATMPLSEENTNEMNTRSFRECFARALVSSINNDPRRNAEYLDDKKRTAYERDKAVRAAFRDAIASGSDEKVKAALDASRGKTDKDDSDVD